MIVLVIPVFNRANYVTKCFSSLERITTKPDLIVIVDDGSTEQMPFCPLPHKYIKQANTGVRGALMTGIEYAFKQKADLVINLDSDAIVKPDFIERLTELHANSNIVCGFNCDSVQNPVKYTFDNHVVKEYANGINMCFNKAQYLQHIKPSLLKEGNWDYNTSLSCRANNQSFLITKPSVVQHIGIQSSMGHHCGDFVSDFKQLSLPNVTLFGIDSHDIAGIERAAKISQQDIEFGAVNIITEDRFTKGGNNEVRRRDYSKFMIKELTHQFATSHVLTIHADGYVLNHEAWSDEFLQFDYIGATWLYKDGWNVGNGGFSLRSKKLCDILTDNDIDEALMHPEDHCICRNYRKALEDVFGIKFAPEEVANRFSIEAYGSNAIHGADRYSGQFGFHSRHVDFTGTDLRQDRLLPQLKQQTYNFRR